MYHDRDLAKIFKRFVVSASLVGNRYIFEAIENCWQEQANGNASSQRDADIKLEAIVNEVVKQMTEHDKQHISNLLHLVVS